MVPYPRPLDPARSGKPHDVNDITVHLGHRRRGAYPHAAHMDPVKRIFIFCKAKEPRRLVAKHEPIPQTVEAHAAKAHSASPRIVEYHARHPRLVEMDDAWRDGLDMLHDMTVEVVPRSA